MLDPEDKRRKLNVSYDALASEHHEYNLRFSKKYITNKRVLDLGCWSGQFAKLAAKYAKDVVGVDPGKAAIAYATEHIKSAKFVVGNALSIPFGNNFFDTVAFLDVIEHLPNGTEQKALSEINRVLKINGYLVLSTPNSHPISILLDPAYFLIGHRHYSLASLEHLLKSSGFEILLVSQTGGIARLLAVISDSIYKLLGFARPTRPNWLKALIANEYVKGFAQNHIIARKLRSL